MPQLHSVARSKTQKQCQRMMDSALKCAVAAWKREKTTQVENIISLGAACRWINYEYLEWKIFSWGEFSNLEWSQTCLVGNGRDEEEDDRCSRTLPERRKLPWSWGIGRAFRLSNTHLDLSICSNPSPPKLVGSYLLRSPEGNAACGARKPLNRYAVWKTLRVRSGGFWVSTFYSVSYGGWLFVAGGYVVVMRVFIITTRYAWLTRVV